MYDPDCTERERKNQRRRKTDVARVTKRQGNNIARGLCRACGGDREDANYQRCNKCREMQRFSQLKYVYGITTDEYNRLLKEQDGVCWICREKEQGKNGNLHVDHDHKTGRVRGLLCSNCNRAIGFLHHSPELLKRAIKYLEGQG